jgi:hypothetical protein
MIKLNTPFKSARKDKKFSVYILKDGKRKLLHYGDPNYQDFTQHKDKKRREAYRKRARGILLKSGKPAYLDKRQPAYWSYNFLWA